MVIQDMVNSISRKSPQVVNYWIEGGGFYKVHTKKAKYLRSLSLSRNSKVFKDVRCKLTLNNGKASSKPSTITFLRRFKFAHLNEHFDEI